MSYISNAGAGGVGTGTVTNTGTLTANKLTMGDGGVDISSSGVDATNPLFNTLVAQPSTAVGALVGRVVLGGSEYGVEVQNKANNAHIAGIDGLGALDGKLIRMNGSGSGVVTIQPAAAAGTWALTLPTDDGTNGQVLTTNGSGVCSWAAGGGSSAFNAISSGTNTTAAMVVGTGGTLAATGTGTITATNVRNVTTNFWISVTAEVFASTGSLSGAASQIADGLASANDIRYISIQVRDTVAVGHIVATLGTQRVGKLAGWAIYDSPGTTLIGQVLPTTIGGTAGDILNGVIDGGAKTLTPGNYLVAFSQDNGPGALLGLAITSGASATGKFFDVINTNNNFYGLAANTWSNSTGFPATLGALTKFAALATSSGTMPALFLTP